MNHDDPPRRSAPPDAPRDERLAEVEQRLVRIREEMLVLHAQLVYGALMHRLMNRSLHPAPRRGH
jgi:hypothetical protein